MRKGRNYSKSKIALNRNAFKKSSKRKKDLKRSVLSKNSKSKSG
jgi:hypothetical protein